MLTYTDLDQTAAFAALTNATPFDVRQLSALRVSQASIPIAEGLSLNWAAAPVDEAILDHLAALAREQQLIAKYTALASGDIMNTGEGRMVLHHLVRGELASPLPDSIRERRNFYLQEQRRVARFAAGIRSGEEKTAGGERFESVVQIGIGGSDLGPRALYLALEEWARAHSGGPIITAHTISNVDPDDAAAVIERINPRRTLFIVVSKSGTTQETLTNEQFVREIIRERDPALDLSRHMVAVTSETSPMASSSSYREAFYIDDFIGGRYSATSAVGGVVLSVAFGPEVFEELLAGAHSADRAAMAEDIRSNATMLDALIGVYERSVLGMPATAVLPYSQALSRFPAHLQQLDMESNGKRVNRDGAPIDYPTGPLVFGEPGTNGQHSFYQLLHQGTTVVPLQFIAFRESQIGQDTTFDGSTSQTKLNANLAAQIVAFARGRHHENGARDFPGGRPSTLVSGAQLNPRSLGALLAYYENKVMFQGLLWNVNSFDQEGVQLGKLLTHDLLAGNADPELLAYARVLDV